MIDLTFITYGKSYLCLPQGFFKICMTVFTHKSSYIAFKDDTVGELQEVDCGDLLGGPLAVGWTTSCGSARLYIYWRHSSWSGWPVTAEDHLQCDRTPLNYC